MSLVSVAIAGYRRIGRLCHEIIRANPALGFRVVAIADLEPVEAGDDGTITTRDYRDLLGSRIDSLLIARPRARKSQQAGFQYICTLNSDTVPWKEFSKEFDLSSYVKLQLTDRNQDGGLLGIRF